MGLGFLLRFYLLSIPVGADAARRELEKRKALGRSPCLRKRGCGQRLSLFPSGSGKGGERQRPEKKTSVIFAGG